MQLYSPDKYEYGTKLDVDGITYIVTTCLDLGWITKGETNGYHLVLTILN